MCDFVLKTVIKYHMTEIIANKKLFIGHHYITHIICQIAKDD